MNRRYKQILLRETVVLLLLCIGLWVGGALLLFKTEKISVLSSLLFAAGLFLIWINFQVWKKGECLIHPYFERQLPEESPDTAFEGENLAKNLDELDDFLVEHQYSAISKFGFKDHYQNSKMDWYDPAELIQSLEFLLNGKKEMDQALKQDLENILLKLKFAEQEGVRFCLHMRMTNMVSGYEMDSREGSYY